MSAAPYTAAQLREFLPKRSDDFCVAMERLAGFDLATLKMIQWIFDDCGNINPDGLRAAICDDGCINYCAEFGSVTPDIKSANPSWFNDGAIFAAGSYRIFYVSGGLSYTGASNSFSVQDPLTMGNGYKIVYGGGESDSPGDNQAFTTIPLCEAHNDGEFVDIVHTGGKIGVYLDDNPYRDNVGGVTFRLECSPATTTTTPIE